MTFEDLKNNLEGNLKKLYGKKSVVVKFIDSGDTFSINENQQFWAASVIKIPIIVELFRQAEDNSIDLEKKHSIKPENRVKGSGIAHLLDENSTYTAKDLAKLAIILSDNAATNEIVDLVGKENVENHIKKLGLENTTFKHKMMIKAGKGPNLTTTKDIASLLEKLYKNELPSSKDIVNILIETKLRDRIPKHIPNDIKIAHKTGSLQKAVHDVGIIYTSNPFIFCFLSDDQEDKELTKDIIGKCTKLCFEYAQNAK